MNQAEKLKKIEGLLKKAKGKAVAPIMKVIEQPNYSPAVIEQSKETARIASQAIASMRDSVNNNQAVMGEIIHRLSIKPKEFIIQRDGRGDMVKIIPVYEKP